MVFFKFFNDVSVRFKNTKKNLFFCVWIGKKFICSEKLLFNLAPISNGYVRVYLTVFLLTDWVIDWLSDWLIQLSTDWVVDWLSDWLIEWLTDWLVEWLNDWVLDWLSDWLIELLIDCLRDRWRRQTCPGSWRWLSSCLSSLPLPPLRWKARKVS